MNYFESFYGSLFYSRKKNGMPPASTLLNANILLSCSLFLFVASVIGMLILIFPNLGDAFMDFLKDIFGRSGGRTMGKIIALLGIASFYPIVRFTIGTPSNYQSILTQCENMSAKELKKVAQKGTIFIMVTLGSWVIPMLIW